MAKAGIELDLKMIDDINEIASQPNERNLQLGKISLLTCFRNSFLTF